MRLKTVVSLHRQNRESASKEPNAIRAISSESGFERSSIRQNDKTNGYCINFEEKWEDKLGHFEEIEITCKQIEFGNVKYENDWA